MDIVAQAGLPTAAGDSTPGQIHCVAGGVARNVAANLARLGHVTHLVSVVGDDAFGVRLSEATQEAGVNVAAVQVVPGQRTATYLSVHGVDGDTQVAVNDMAVMEQLTPERLRAHEALVQRAAALVLDCNVPSATLDFLLTHAGSVPVWVDGVSAVKCQKLAPWLARIHTLKLNHLEAQALCALPVSSPAQALDAARQLHARGVAQVVISLGAQGLVWCDAQGLPVHVPAPRVAVVNTSGAGDALLAGLVHAHAGGLSLSDSIGLAMACAELTLLSPMANDPALSAARAQACLLARQAPRPWRAQGELDLTFLKFEI